MLSNARGAAAAMTRWSLSVTYAEVISLCVSRFSAGGYLYAWLASLFNLILVRFVEHKQKYNMRTCVALI
jgi:hypothetical protein